MRYTIEKMAEVGILQYRGDTRTYYEITDMSFYGIQLLEKLRPQPIWNNVKSVMAKSGIHTLEFIETLLHDVAVETAKQAVCITMSQK